MSANDTAADNGHGDAQIDDRTHRALTETLTVLTPDGTPVENPDRTSFSVTSASGATYTVDLATNSCDCAAAEYRDPAGGCKHVRRCRVATGREPVPAAVDVDDQHSLVCECHRVGIVFCQQDRNCWICWASYYAQTPAPPM